MIPSLNSVTTNISYKRLNITPPNTIYYINQEMLEQDNPNNPENNDICSNFNENINNNEKHSILDEKKDMSNPNYDEHFFEEIITKHFKPTNIYGDDDESENTPPKADKTTEIKKDNFIEDKNVINPKDDDVILGKQKNKINKKHKKCITTKFLNKKRKKTIFFRTENRYIQFGNKLLIKNFRVPNIKNKTLRIFIQEIIPFWLTEAKPNKNKKLNVNKIINNYKNHEYKDMKISDFISKNIKIPNNIDKDIISIKLQFTLKEAFLCFAKETSSKEILRSVLDRLGLKNKRIDMNKFFIGLDTKNMYINGLAEKERDYNNILKAFSQLVEEFNADL